MPTNLDSSGETIGEETPDHISFDIGFGNPLDTHTQEELHEIAVGWGVDAQRKFDESIPKLFSIIRSCSPITLLCHFAYYDTFFFEKYGDESDYSPVEQHNIEILQALILSIPEADLSNERPTSDQRMGINQLLKDASSGFALKRLTLESGLESIIREQARSHTQTVRNPGSEGQILRNFKELFGPLDSILFRQKGVTFSGLIALGDAFKDKVIFRFNDHRRILQRSFREPTREQMIEVFGEGFGLSSSEINFLKTEDARECSEPKHTKTALFNYSEKFYPRMFSAEIDELSAMYPGEVDRDTLKKALATWSSAFGDLQTSNIEHVFLNNPVWQKPFIQVADGVYFWPIFAGFVSFGLEMLEAQMESSQELKDAYHDRRSLFTENKTAELLSAIGPGARLLPNLQWRDPNTGQNWENDLLILFDCHAIIVECKSGRIKDAARRGGGSLNEALKKLIQEPTEQGYRFEQFLRLQTGPIKLANGKGLIAEIDAPKILRYTRLNVLLDYLGPLATQDKLLRRTGIVSTVAPSAVTMALVDLENILYLIERPGKRLHYLHRRAAFERTFEIMGDELDLVAYYLAGERWPADQRTKMALAGCSRKLDPYLRRRDLGLSKKIPTLKRNSWWKDILERVESKTRPGWTEVWIALLSFPISDQEQYRSVVESTLLETSISPQQTVGREIICGAVKTPEEIVGFATYVTVRDTRDRNREKLSVALDHLSDGIPKPDCGLAVVVFPDSYPYNNLGMAYD